VAIHSLLLITFTK